MANKVESPLHKEILVPQEKNKAAAIRVVSENQTPVAAAAQDAMKPDVPARDVVSLKTILDQVQLETALPRKVLRRAIESAFTHIHHELQNCNHDVSCGPLGKLKAVQRTNKEGESYLIYKLVLR